MFFGDKLCLSTWKTMFSSEKLFFDRKTLFIGDKQSLLIYYTSGLRENFKNNKPDV